jgi:heat shock protein HtpX
MPLTFIDIEKQKNWRIWLFFLLLMLIYFVGVALFTIAFLPSSWYSSPRFWIFTGAMVLLVTGMHFWFSAFDTVNTVVRELSAQPPDPQDEIHTRLINIMQEVHVVTGNKRTMRCVVIPSLSMNALAVVDLKGESAIGITEGLLSRLTRPQLEAVIAHEAHHILSGDCIETTIASSLFGVYSSAFEKFVYTLRGRAFVSPAFLFSWILLRLSHLLNMFISREREYRADSASVRMTRNPIALAEALHLLARSWRGAGFIGSGFEMLCIVNPQVTALDEAEGFWANLISTHPPLSKRIEVLLSMARVSIAELEAKTRKTAGADTQKSATASGYYAMSPRQQWQGPFTTMELAVLPWLSPLTWISQGQELPVDRAWKDPLLKTVFLERLTQQAPSLANITCPTCRQPIIRETYEGTPIHQCRFCAGILVNSDRIPRIIARTNRDGACSERITSLAKTVVNENLLRRPAQKNRDNEKTTIPLLACPKCSNPMYRGFFSQAHLIEVDRCSFCGITWFEQDELEMLQCLIENRIVPDIPEPDSIEHSVL